MSWQLFKVFVAIHLRVSHLRQTGGYVCATDFCPQWGVINKMNFFDYTILDILFTLFQSNST